MRGGRGGACGRQGRGQRMRAPYSVRWRHAYGRAGPARRLSTRAVRSRCPGAGAGAAPGVVLWPHACTGLAGNVRLDADAGTARARRVRECGQRAAPGRPAVAPVRCAPQRGPCARLLPCVHVCDAEPVIAAALWGEQGRQDCDGRLGHDPGGVPGLLCRNGGAPVLRLHSVGRPRPAQGYAG